MTLHFENVSYRYPNIPAWVIHELNLSIAPGESILIAGASGSGKSTIGRASMGLVPHFYGGELVGRVWVDGMDTRQHPVYQLFGHVGMVFQNTDAQLFNQTVEAELAYGLESLGLGSAEIEQRLTWASDLVGLGPFLGRPPHTLSGGQKELVALGAILALQPRLLIMDEPFTHLDSEGSERLRTILRRVQIEGIALVIIEHRLHEVISDVDRLVVLHQGGVVADGPPRQVLIQDISNYGLNLPPLMQLFREQGWPHVPLNVDEALHALKNLPEGLKVQHLSLQTPSPLNASEQDHPRINFLSDPRNPVLETENIRFRYNGQTTLNGVSLSLARGECMALVGRNGAGKTTLVKHFNGLLRPEQGRVKVHGQDIRKTSVAELARHIGFAWQNPNDQLFQSTVREEVLTGPRVLHTFDQAWCDHLFDRFDLKTLFDRSPFQLSEGQKKRVAFATALASCPEIVVLDEPTAGQDEPFRRELGKLIAELRVEGRTVVIVTHDLEFAAKYADRWLALANGRIVADGPPETVMADTEAMRTAGLRPTQLFQLKQDLIQ